MSTKIIGEHMVFSIVLTTVDNSRILQLYRLFDSLKIQNEMFQLIFIYQQKNEEISVELKKYLYSIGESVILKIIPAESLSVARNYGLMYATGDVIIFSDDDCWYPSNLLKKIADLFTTQAHIDILCTNVYDPINEKYYGNRPVLEKVVTLSNLYKLPISVGIFARARCIKGLKFDESLGAGTAIGSGEETMFLYNALTQRNAQIWYNGLLNVYHPVPIYEESDIQKYYKYGFGFGYTNGLIFKEKHYSHLLFVFEVILRSVIGMCIKRKNDSAVYRARFLGIVQGFSSALQN